MEADKTLLRLIDEEIARLQVARSEILSRLRTGVDSSDDAKLNKAGAVKTVSRKGKTREEQLMEFLKVNGPSAPKAILAGTGMPRGSLGFTLTRVSEKIERFEDGRIALKR